MKGDLFMGALAQKEVIGIKDLRTNLSNIIDKAIADFDVFTSGNVKKGSSNTVTIMSTDMYEELLNAYFFKPIIKYDEVTKQWEVHINEIGVYSCADSKEKAIDEAVELAIDSTNEFIENKEIYLRMEKFKKLFPYYILSLIHI